MKRFACVCLGCFSLITAHAASFDCAKALSKVEHFICDNSTLSTLDDELSDAYKRALDIDEDNDLLRSEQKHWLSNVRNSCSDMSCLENAYNERIRRFSTLLAHSVDLPRSQIIFSTYLGGKGDDRATGVRVDRAGNIYIGGFTQAWDDFPTLNAIQNKRQGRYSGIVAKFSRAGVLQWATHLGGAKSNFQYSNYEAFNQVAGIAFDAADNLYVSGDTDAIDFPIVNAAQPSPQGAGEAFLTKFDKNGKLIWSTYIGGYGIHYIRAVAADREGSVYLAGHTRQSGGLASVIAKFDSSGTFVWKKEVGGTETNAIAVDGAGNIYIGGSAKISPLPKQIGDANYAKGQWQNPYVAKFNRNGDILWSTKLGGADQDGLTGIDTDQAGNVYIAGNTRSKEFPTLNAAQSSRPGREDAFVAKFNTDGKLLWSTYLGSTGDDTAMAIAVDVKGYIHVTGSTASTNFPTKMSFQKRKAGLVNAFITTYSSEGKIVRSSYLGGSGNKSGEWYSMAFDSDIGRSIAADNDANVYVTGCTGSGDFPLKNPYQGTFGGLNDIFVTKIDALK